ncbi:MAG TPA: CRTAC1 family protein [Gemmatimonadales bacterium]|nr:CRTAC1 family protein [Gemmatimonadales bacterium]
MTRLVVVPALVFFIACRSNENSRRTPTPDWLLERARTEDGLLARSTVMHDFRFSDRRAASGITFENRIVDDAGKAYKKVHYDHGTGLCAADVDGDGLPDLYFMTQLGSNELWKNLGGGRFADITDQAGLRMSDAVAVGCAFADIDNDGLPDLFVTTVRHGNRLFKNLGGGTFTDITAQAGVGYVGHSSGAVFFDYDGDGLLDLFVTNVGVYTTNQRGPGGYYVGLPDAFHGHTHPERDEESILYKNLGGGRFKDVTREVGLVDRSWSGDATVIDVNDDGWPDLYVLDMQGENHLWLNEGGKRFRDATKQYFPKTPWGAMGVKAFDFDGDGRVDLFVTDMHSDMWVNIPPGDWAAEARKADTAPAPPDFFPTGKRQFIFGNALYANRGNGRYVEASDSLGVETYWPWGPTVDDLNADGWDDIFITAGMNFPHRYGINSVLLNDAGRQFLPSEFSLGIEPRADGEEQVWFRLDCQGTDRQEPFCTVCSKAGSAALGCRQGPGGQVTMMASRGSRSAVAVDLDDDGDLDLVTNEFNAPPQVLVSDLAQRHRIHFLKIRLRGTRSNREGLGAQVTVVLPNGRRILKVMDGKSGYLSQSDLPLYFGLGDADHAATIEVRWPSGQRQTVAGPVPAGQTREIVEP